jgi:cyclopropane-fatty-acyl-phospholipid synthase
MTGIAERAVALAESGKIPDSVIRAGMRGLISQRRRQVRKLNGGDVNAFVEMMDASPIALVPDRANEQHSEVPAEFFAQVLGRHRKYSSCFWSEGAETLDDAEEAALEVTCRRAAIKDGQQVLDLGCGWGSLSLWIDRQCRPAHRPAAPRGPAAVGR